MRKHLKSKLILLGLIFHIPTTYSDEIPTIARLVASLPSIDANQYQEIRHFRKWNLSSLTRGINPKKDSLENTAFAVGITACMKLSLKVDQEKARHIHYNFLLSELKSYEKFQSQGFTVPNRREMLEIEVNNLSRYTYRLDCIYSPNENIESLEDLTNSDFSELRSELIKLNNSYPDNPFPNN